MLHSIKLFIAAHDFKKLLYVACYSSLAYIFLALYSPPGNYGNRKWKYMPRAVRSSQRDHLLAYSLPQNIYYPDKHGLAPKVGWMLSQRYMRRASIKPALDKRLVYIG